MIQDSGRGRELDHEPQAGRMPKFNLVNIMGVGAVYAGSVLFFTGDQFLTARIRALGWGTSPIDHSIQQTMAIGADVLVNGWFFPLIGALLIATYMLILLLEAILKRAYQKINEMLPDTAEQQWTERIAALRGEASKLKAQSYPTTDEEVEDLEKKIYAAEVELNQITKTFDRYKSLTSSSYLMFIILFGGFFGIMLAIGQVQGRHEGRVIRNDVRGKCDKCAFFRIGSDLIEGQIVDASQSTIVIARRQGLTLAAAAPTVISYGFPVVKVIPRR